MSVLSHLRYGKLPLQPAIEAATVGFFFAWLDIHSTNEDVFNSGFCYTLAAVVLGWGYGGRAWQAWIPLSASLYLVHRIAITHGYRPPYVEENTTAALRCLQLTWLVGFWLVVGMLIRNGITSLRRRAADQAHAQPEDVPPGPATPDARLTARRLMLIVALIAVHLAYIRAVLKCDPFFGFGTVYSQGFSESRFATLRQGMTEAEVMKIMGPPIHKVDWEPNPASDDRWVWFYSDQIDWGANYWRRWVIFKNGRVEAVVSDFWFD